jgi:hypothetical protein
MPKGSMTRRGSLAQEATPQSNGFSKAVNRLTNAVGPTGEKMGQTTPELIERNIQALQDAAPPTKPSTVRAPAILERVNGLTSNIEGRFKGLLNRPMGNSTIGDSVKIDGARIADAIEKKITSGLEKSEPDVAAALRAEAENYRNHPAGTNNINVAGPNGTLTGPPKRFTLNELNEIRQMKNAQNDAFHSGDQMQQFVQSKNPQATKIANRVIENEARNLLYEEMGKQGAGGLSEPEIRAMKQQQGDMMAVKQQLQDRLASLTEDAASGKGAKLLNKIRGSVKPYATPHGMGMHASSLLNLIEPQAMTDLRGIAAADQVFAPRTSPFAPVVPGTIAALLAQRKKR